MKRSLKVAGLIFLGLIIMGVMFENPNKSEVIASTKVKVDRSPEMQKGRRKLIEKMIGMGIFTKINRPGGSLMYAYTGRKWAILTFDEKQKFVSVVAAYAGDPKEAYHVPVYDGGNNHSIGYYSTDWGLVLD